MKTSCSGKILEEWHRKDNQDTCILSWDTKKLSQKISNLGKTAIITGLPVQLNGVKAYHFRYVQILGEPDESSFFRLLSEGAITLDHCISIREGKTAAREQGPLFKVNSESREELYGTIQKYDLLDL